MALGHVAIYDQIQLWWLQYFMKTINRLIKTITEGIAVIEPLEPSTLMLRQNKTTVLKHHAQTK